MYHKTARIQDRNFEGGREITSTEEVGSNDNLGYPSHLSNYDTR